MRFQTKTEIIDAEYCALVNSAMRNWLSIENDDLIDIDSTLKE